MMRLGPEEAEPSGSGAVHGVAHRLKFEDFATLTNMEHEYRCEASPSCSCHDHQCKAIALLLNVKHARRCTVVSLWSKVDFVAHHSAERSI